MTYRKKLEEALVSELGVNPAHAKEIVELIENEGEFVPCAFKILKAPDNVDNWDEKLPYPTDYTEKVCIGRIEWLHTNGKVRELREYGSLEALINDAATELEYGVPITVVVYTNCSEEEYKNACDKIAYDSGAIPSGGFKYENVNNRITYYKKLWNDQCTFEEFCQYVRNMGDWGNVNDRETIRGYVKEKIEEDVCVAHILEAIESNPHDKLFCIWLGSSMETPTPIRTKTDLIEALGLSYEDLDRLIWEEYTK